MRREVTHHIPFGFPFGVSWWKLLFSVTVFGHHLLVYRPMVWPRLRNRTSSEQKP